MLHHSFIVLRPSLAHAVQTWTLLLPLAVEHTGCCHGPHNHCGSDHVHNTTLYHPEDEVYPWVSHMLYSMAVGASSRFDPLPHDSVSMLCLGG
jgi:hypothetical protein